MMGLCPRMMMMTVTTKNKSKRIPMAMSITFAPLTGPLRA
jgi:hypothetical protein